MVTEKQPIHLGPATLDRYVETRRALLRLADELTVRMLALEPVKTLAQMNEMLAFENDRKLVFEMVASCSFIIDWLSSGRPPGRKRGIERTAGYQREIPTDPAKLSALGPPMGNASTTDGSMETDDPQTKLEQGNVASAQTKLHQHRANSPQTKLEQAMRGLSARERDCYVLAHGECFTFSEIAELLGITKSSVGTYMLRAERKIADNVGHSATRVG